MKSLDSRSKRKIRIRKKVYGDSSKPRLAVFKSNKNIYVQAIDDLNQTTIGSASTLSKELKSDNLSIDTAKKVGELVAKRAIEKGIKKVTFDRSGYKYHGRVKSLAESAREAGLEF